MANGYCFKEVSDLAVVHNFSLFYRRNRRMNGLMGRYLIGELNRKCRRLSAADGEAVGVMVGRDHGYYHQHSSMMLFDSTGDECVGECTLSPLAHLQPNGVSNPGCTQSQEEIETGEESASLLEIEG